MLLAQAILSSFLDLTRIGLYAYFVLSTNIPKSSYQRSVDGLLLQISILLLYGNCSKSFYVYTLTSGFFRRIFRHTAHVYYEKILHIIHIRQDPVQNTTQYGLFILKKSRRNVAVNTDEGQ